MEPEAKQAPSVEYHSILRHLDRGTPVVLVGELGDKKRRVLTEVGDHLGLEVLDAIDINDPIVGNGRLPNENGVILVEDNGPYEQPSSMCPKDFYSSAVIATTHELRGVEYARRLTGKEPEVVHMPMGY